MIKICSASCVTLKSSKIVLTANPCIVVIHRTTTQYAPCCKKAKVFLFKCRLGNISCDADDVDDDVAFMTQEMIA
jgi:hypothetical protein